MTQKSETQQKELTIFRLNCNRLDFNNAANVEYLLKRTLSSNKERKHLVIDFTQVKYICSLGLSCLLGVYKFAKRQSTAIYLINLSATIRQILEQTAFEQFLFLNYTLPQLLLTTSNRKLTYKDLY